MQVRPIAAEAVGAERFEAPDDNVRAGCDTSDSWARCSNRSVASTD